MSLIRAMIETRRGEGFIPVRRAERSPASAPQADPVSGKCKHVTRAR